MEDSEQQRPNFILSAETQRLVKVLEKVTIGDTITYGQLCQIAGDYQLSDLNKIRGALQTARRRLQREQHFVFGCVQGVGLKRINDAEIVQESGRKISGLKRGYRRTSNLLACPDPKNLTPEQTKDLLVKQSVIGVIGVALHVSTERKIEQYLVEHHKVDRLEIGDIIDVSKRVNG